MNPHVMPVAPIGVPDFSKRRGAARVAHRAPCRIVLLNQAERFECAGRTVNLSSNGAALEAPHALPLGAAVLVQVDRLDDSPLLLRGRVARARQVLSGTFEIGVAFEPDATFRRTSG